MADSGHVPEQSTESETEKQVTFTVKASNDQKYVLTLPLSTTVADLKSKLSTSEYADVSADRIRLIYSGRVLKDADTLTTCKLVDGNTVHMVKGAASNARQNPAASASTSGTGSTPAAPAVPMAAGTGNNPLAGLTGARYAGFHGLPNASMFGADGGMGPPPGPDELLRLLDDPNFAQMMNESANNPQVIQMLQSHPQIRDNPILRNMLSNESTRRMLFSPEMMRMQMQMQRAMNAESGGGSFPMPGATDTTPGTNNTGTQQPDANSANPFAALFGGAPPFTAGAGTTPATSPPATASAGGQGTPSTNTDQAAQNPFANLFGGGGAGAAGTGGQGDMFAMARQMMADPAMRESMMRSFGGAGGQQAGGQADPFGGFNPWAMGGGAPPAPADDRPPEERYAEQLRQLNEMGFYEFERNVTALRRSGGNVQGAIDFLLGGGS